MAKSKGYLITSTVVAALGGFLFGFDTAVISGAERDIQLLFDLDDWAHGFTVSVALYGTVIGALIGGYPAEKFGRKKTLIWIAILYFFSALGSALANNWELFIIARFIGGLGVGASSVVGPMYISEISPAAYRGRLVALFQFNIVLGILIAYFSNYLLGNLEGDNIWRWMVGVEAVPAAAFFFALQVIPESPRWLLKRGEESTSRDILSKVGEPDVDQAIDQIKISLEEGKSSLKERFFSKKYRWPIILAFLFAFFNQVSGINAIIYYAPRIFEMAGLEKGSALLSSVGIGTINLVFTVIAMSIIDRYGRKFLMKIGTVGLIFSLFMLSYTFFTDKMDGGMAVPIYIFAYIGFFAVSQGAVIWVFISEIFPNKVRAQGQSLGSFTHWIMAAIIAQLFPGITAAIGGGYTFLFFAIMMVLQMGFVLFMMPETKGRSLEEIQKEMGIK